MKIKKNLGFGLNVNGEKKLVYIYRCKGKIIQNIIIFLK